MSDDAENSAHEKFFFTLTDDLVARGLVTRVTGLCDELGVRHHYTHTGGGDLRVEADRRSPAPFKRNVITMTWRARKGYFSCQSLLSVAECINLGMPANSVRTNNGVLSSCLNVQPGLHAEVFLAVVEASIRRFRER